MISFAKDPEAWALLMYQLDDTLDHLQKLIDQMALDGDIDEEDFQIQLSHIYAHLNRSWYLRSGESIGDSDTAWIEASKFPTDLEPIG